MWPPLFGVGAIFVYKLHPPEIVRTGPLMVEVLFIPVSGDDTSWVRCEVDEGIYCSSD